MAHTGPRIRYLRKSEKLTQQELATAIGVAKSTISMYENGQRKPDFETLEAIADYFNVDMNYLTGWTADPYDYEMDPDNRFAEIPSAQYEQLNRVYSNDLSAMWNAWRKMQDDTAEEATREVAEMRTPVLPSSATPIDFSKYHQIPILGRI